VRRRAIQVAMHSWVRRFDRAAEDIEILFQSGIKDAELLAWRARCHVETGQYDKARQCFEEAIRQPKKNHEDFLRLAYLLRQHAANVMWGEKTVEQVFQTADQKIDDMLA